MTAAAAVRLEPVGLALLPQKSDGVILRHLLPGSKFGSLRSEFIIKIPQLANSAVRIVMKVSLISNPDLVVAGLTVLAFLSDKLFPVPEHAHFIHTRSFFRFTQKSAKLWLFLYKPIVAESKPYNNKVSQ